MLPRLSSYCVPGGFHAGIEGCASTVHALREAHPTYASPSSQFQAGFLEFFMSRSCCSIDIVLCVNLHISCDGHDCCQRTRYLRRDTDARFMRMPRQVSMHNSNKPKQASTVTFSCIT